MIVECPYCQSQMRVESRALEGVPRVRCGACLGEFDALEHIKLDAALGIGDAGDSKVRKHAVPESEPTSSTGEMPHIQQRRSVLTSSQPQARGSKKLRLAVVVGAAVLLLVGVHVGRDQLATSPFGHTLATRWCGLVGCSVQPPQDFSAIRLLRRQIYAHPSREDALVISLAMVNDAHFAQDFPVLHVRMTDRDGEVVARGEFTPAEYLDTFDTSVLMQPGRAVDVQLEVADPGSKAVSFDLEFH